jgi:hypothetical protein
MGVAIQMTPAGWIYVVNLIFYGIGAALWILVILDMLRLDTVSAFKMLGIATASTAIFINVLYIFLQIEWMVSIHDATLSPFIAYVWVLWDYILSVFMICLALWSRVVIHLCSTKVNSFVRG